MGKYVLKPAILGGLLVLIFSLCSLAGLDGSHIWVTLVFSGSILGTLLFWNLRLSFMFIGSALLFLGGNVDLEHFIRYASFDVILFLIGMMIVIAMVKNSGVFHFALQYLMRLPGMSGRLLFIIILCTGALLSALMGEIASTLILIAIIIEMTDHLEIDPVPLVIASVITTNIGSAATLLGNPVGVLIALRANLSFVDFLTHALPVTLIVLAITVAVLIVWFRKYIHNMSEKLSKQRSYLNSIPMIEINRDSVVSLIVFGLTISAISIHTLLEKWLHVTDNNLLIMIPICAAGVVIALRRDQVHRYIENEVEWTSLLFFIFLFAETGVLQASGLADRVGQGIIHLAGGSSHLLQGITLIATGLLSSILDNTVVVATFIPLVKGMSSAAIQTGPLWWCILFGACIGGNITTIGSAANIVAIGLLEKEKQITISFMKWLWIGLLTGVIGFVVSYGAVLLLPVFRS
ncbi:sodium:proton antiporter [bacterium]|nr:sodium:proton antiporter [bacterium]MBU1635589.1 sodium:proton antiporter [bacterium]MBU1873747.1 sodium:proton antiporter [bacterium]